MKVLVIGAGNMGLTYAEGMSKSKLLKKKNIMVLDSSEEKLQELHQISHFDAFDRLEECVPRADIIFIAVKPYHAESLLKGISPMVKTEQILISIMAVVTIETPPPASPTEVKWALGQNWPSAPTSCTIGAHWGSISL